MSVNKVILIGNVGKDPEVRYLEGGIAVASFTLATTERGYKTQSGVQIPERTEWHNIIAWRGLAEIAEKYVRKGSQLYIEGKIRSRSWDDKQGSKHYITEIYADNLQILGARTDNAQSANVSKPASDQNWQNPAYQGTGAQDSAKSQTLSERQSQPAPSFSENNGKEELPF